MKDKAAQEMARKRWKGTTAEERSEAMKLVAARGAGRPRSKIRCPCGQNTLHTAEIHKFKCCRKAGLK